MPTRALRLASVRGVEVRLDVSLVLLALLLGWLLYGRFSLAYGAGLALGMAVAASVLFFASILAHEIAHAFEALHRGIEVRRITLLLFGGVTEMHGESQRPRDEFAVAAVGPYVSLLCAALFGLVVAAAVNLPAGIGTPLIDVARLLALLNLLLAAFNLVPGAPLDGGRVLRAGLWWLLGDRLKAVRIAAWAGMAFAGVLALTGLWLVARTPGTLATGGWWILIGLFLFGAARAELRHGHLQELLLDRTVGDVLEPSPRSVDSDVRADLVDTDAAPEADVILVTDGDGELLGWLEPGELARLHPADRAVRTAGELMHPVSEAPPIDEREPLRALVDRFVEGDHDRLRAEREGIPVGVLTEARTARVLGGLRGAGMRARRSRASDQAPT